jgi:hypothetical protein
MGTGLAFRQAARRTDLPGDPDQIGAACEFQDGIDDRHVLHQRPEAKPDADQQRQEPRADPQHVRDRPAKAEIHA